ncbi:MAG: 30S ribosomal protein S3ae [Desulfurococcales archaeon]|nr:30S ribosomal protein S3ae [Desulfurococcales archaeon]
MPKVTVRDKWKLKKWYTVLAPSLFGNVPIGTTPADREWKLLGRVFEVTLFDLTGDFSKHHIHLYFQVYEIKDDVAYTRFKGHELARDYIKSVVRRKSSKVAAIVNVTTKDGYGLRATGMALTAFRCKTSQKRAIRKMIFRVLEERAREMTLDEYIKAMIFGKLAAEIMEQGKKIYPVRKAEIYKSKLLTIPSPEGPKPAIIVPQPQH